MYGLRQTPRAWYNKIESYFAQSNFVKCFHEHTLFVKNNSKGRMLIVSLYVDDLIYTGDDIEMFESFKHSMQRNFAITDLGKMRYFLGVEVKQCDEGIFISQGKYSTEILERFGMENCNMVCNPIVTGSKLVKDENGGEVDASKYKQMVGCLMYLLETTPDLSYSVCLVARYMERPTEMHLSAIKRIIRYLKGIVNYGAMYKKGKKVTLTSWSD